MKPFATTTLALSFASLLTLHTCARAETPDLYGPEGLLPPTDGVVSLVTAPATEAAVHITDTWICRYFDTPELLTENFNLHPKEVQKLCNVTLGFPSFSLCPAYEPAREGDPQLDDTLLCSGVNSPSLQR